MKKILGLWLLIFCFTAQAQEEGKVEEYFKIIQLKNQLKDNIDASSDWESVSSFVEQHESLHALFASDIQKTKTWLSTHELKHVVDSFFYDITTKHYSHFPYRSSGNLEKSIYIAQDKPQQTHDFVLPVYGVSSLYKWTQKLNNIPSKTVLQHLYEYLDKDIMTLLSRSSMDYDEAPQFLKMSDVAIELIEIFSYADFYNNASRNRLFSSISQKERQHVKSNIEAYVKYHDQHSRLASVNYYLDSLCAIDYAYIYTCKNLLFAGDTLNAKKHLAHYYQQREMPCKSDIVSGDLLQSLGDARLVQDCVNKITNYRCMSQFGDDCIPRILASQYPYKDDLFAELVYTETHSLYRKKGTGPDYTWHTLFTAIAHEKETTLAQTLIAFMLIEDVLKEANIYRKQNWQRKYPAEYEAGYRVCDFALLHYHQTIKAIKIDHWDHLLARDKAIQSIILKNNASILQR